ncbi:E3 ubiquitin-protein ligase HECW1-like, partial [Sinocyclocheilus grahami]|uniref:E3 ubiquitin-protein ligase HECW1-like n=1 Tax=Sinocyclocheilus grahami TaxID=75366 RepID=UPI0007ACF5E2
NLYQSRFLGLAAMASPSRRRCKSETHFSSARSTSDTDLVSLQSRSTLSASTSLYCIGQSDQLVICWDIREEVDAGDWIGMYLSDEVLSENFLDYKSRGVSGSHKGQIVWRIDASLYFTEGSRQSTFTTATDAVFIVFRRLHIFKTAFVFGQAIFHLDDSML